jgi:hypothetical protein
MKATETEQELADGPQATDGNSNNTGYSRLNLAAYRIDDMSDDDDDGLIDTEGRGDDTVTEKNAVKEKMENYIRIIRDFSDGLEYQVKFQDPRFLTTLEKDGAGFIRLAQNCLSRERRQNSSRVASPSTWERSTANVLFYRARPSRDHGEVEQLWGMVLDQRSRDIHDSQSRATSRDQRLIAAPGTRWST